MSAFVDLLEPPHDRPANVHVVVVFGPDRTQADDAVLDALIRDVRGRLGLVRSLSKDEDEAKPFDFIGSATVSATRQTAYRTIAAQG